MKKYFLTFKDCNTERQYLDQKWNTQRSKDFKYISIMVVVVFLIKVLMALISQNYSLFTFKLVIPCYTVVQYVFVQKNPSYSRIALIMLNIGITLSKLENDSALPTDIIQIKNMNLLLANIMILLSGEFVDAVIQFLCIIFSMIINIAAANSAIYYPTMLTTSIGSLFMIKYLHQYHDGQRSAFILGNVDNQWDKVLYKLIHHSYILLEFNYNNLDYHVINQSKLPFEIKEELLEQIKLKNDKFLEAQYFIENAQVGGINFQNFIFQEIQSYQINFSDQYSRLIHIKFQKQLIQIDYSIFRAKELKILLQIKSIKPQNINQIKHYQERFLKYNAMFLKLLNQIKFYEPQHRSLLKLKEKLSFIQNYEEIMQQKLNLKQLNICQFIILMQNLYPSIKIRFESNLNSGTFVTFPNIFVLLIMIVMNCSRNEQLFFNFSHKEFEDQTILEIIGSFKVSKFHKFYSIIQTQINLIIQKLQISESYLTFSLYSQPLLPFSIENSK